MVSFPALPEQKVSQLQHLQGQGHAAVGDLGGSIITGIDGNPLAVLAAQLNIPLHEINTAGVPLYLEDGRVPDPAIDKKVRHCQQHLYSVNFMLAAVCLRAGRSVYEAGCD